MRKVILLVFCLFFCLSLSSQTQEFTKQVPGIKKYNLSEVYDSTYGINIYERLIPALGGDSVRNDKKGYACQGWVEDHYENGQTLHRGYYVDGQIRIFKNFYDNGQMERSFKLIDFKKSSLEVFYMDGKLKSEITYYEGSPQKWTDYYPNGQVEFVEESAKNMETLIQRSSYFETGRPSSTFQLIDKKAKRYSKKEFYENGKVKEEGGMAYSTSVMDYVKDGTWKTYDEEGKLISEEIYVGGELNQKVK